MLSHLSPHLPRKHIQDEFSVSNAKFYIRYSHDVKWVYIHNPCVHCGLRAKIEHV